MTKNSLNKSKLRAVRTKKAGEPAFLDVYTITSSLEQQV
jgi:hypothetical protein